MRIINVDYTGFVQLDIDSINVYDTNNDYNKVDITNTPIKEIIRKLNIGDYSIYVFEECYDKVLDGEDKMEFSEEEQLLLI